MTQWTVQHRLFAVQQCFKSNESVTTVPRRFAGFNVQINDAIGTLIVTPYSDGLNPFAQPDRLWNMSQLCVVVRCGLLRMNAMLGSLSAAPGRTAYASMAVVRATFPRHLISHLLGPHGPASLQIARFATSYDGSIWNPILISLPANFVHSKIWRLQWVQTLAAVSRRKL